MLQGLLLIRFNVKCLVLYCWYATSDVKALVVYIIMNYGGYIHYVYVYGEYILWGSLLL